MSLRVFLAFWIVSGLHAVAPPKTTLAVEFRFDRVPRHLWARELVWLKNMGVPAIAVTGLTPEASSVAAQAGLVVIPESDVTGTRISVLGANALVKSRKELMAARPVVWTDVESETAPFFRRGAVALSGDEDASLQALRREANLLHYWSPVLESQTTFSVPNHLPDTIHLEQKAIADASAVSVANGGKQAWTGELHVTLPSYKRAIQIPGVMVPAQDALLLPVDVAFSDPRFCRFCSGMSNSERLLYATEELTAIEYENGILSFEFYAPTAGSVVLQLEREPVGPMLAAGHPIEFDWDSENKRARLPIPAGRAANKRVRIAVTMTGPDDVASFVDTRALMIGQTNHILTDYSSENFAKRSRLILPEGWKAAMEATSEVKSPLQVAYAIDVPAASLHGQYADLRLEADGVGMSHVRLQLLRPVSVHVAEASVLHFGTAAELVSDPPVVPVEGPNGRTFTIQLRNNAPAIRTFQVAVAGDGMEFSPATTEISIGPSMERDVSVRVFAHDLAPGLHDATVRISGAAEYAAAVRFLVIPRGEAVSYAADLADTGQAQTVWENTRMRAVFSEADGGRWIEFYWKESGKSFLPAEGVALTKPVKVELHGDELTIDGAAGLPAGGKIGNVEWKADVQGSVTRYRVTEKPGGG